MKFSHLTDTIILFGDEFDNFQTKLIRVGHNLHLKLDIQVLGVDHFYLLKFKKLKQILDLPLTFLAIALTLRIDVSSTLFFVK